MITISMYLFKMTKKLSSYLSSFKSTAGFTLIELLVVIAILGILAASLVATIDPFEQIKKANDANTKNISVEFINASVRYYTTHNALPWFADTACKNPTGALTAATVLPTLTGCVSALIADGELKQGFSNATNALSSIIISGGSNSVTACFRPQSKAEQRGQNTIYDSTGVVSASGCVANGGGSAATNCYWCSQ